MVAVEVSHEIAYAHRLLHTPGKCTRLHGHNALVTVIVEADDSIVFDARYTGERAYYPNMVSDFGVVKDRLKFVLAQVDHRTVLNVHDRDLAKVLENLGNDVVVVHGDPTAECMAKWVVQNFNMIVKSVRWQETRDCAAIYCP